MLKRKTQSARKMKATETVRQARTIILDKMGNELPAPESTDPQVAIAPLAVKDAGSDKSDKKKEVKNA